jgi:hypothetical protein
VCGVDLLPTGTQCHQCESPIGFPNVRKAESEKKGLLKRFESTNASIKVRDIEDVVSRFRVYLEQESKLIIAKSVPDIIVLGNPSKMMSTYHQEVRANARVAQNNRYDQNRDGYESIVNPQYYENIHYAALSLTNKGLRYYGGVHMSLNLNQVKHRTTLFEENSYNFVVKHKLTGADLPPIGYRATWDDRAILAIVKCSYKLDINSKEEDFSSIIINDDPDNPEFIEAHIYGSLSANTVDNMVLKSITSDDEKMMFRAGQKAFKALGINIEIEK